ncbi:MAG TPA: hypothetical protein P5341_08605 [Hyphomonas sp.]|nr:hypothetical protein [Hyphomonas sp.]
MATYEQLMDAARRADAANDGAAAKRFLELAIEARGTPTGADAMRARGLASPDPAAANAEAAAGVQQARDQALIAENPVGARAVSLLQGAPFVGSYTDEALGALGGEHVRDKIRAVHGAFQRERPNEDMAWKLAGGVVGSAPLAAAAIPSLGAAVPASMGLRVLGGAAVGGGTGAIEGGVYGYGLEGDRAANAREGAAIGGIAGGTLGGLFPLASAGVSAVTRKLLDRPSKAAAKAAGLSPTSTEALLAALNSDDAMTGAGRGRIAQAGPGAMLADAGGSVQNLLDTSIQRSGPGARVASEAISDRAAAAGQSVRQGLGNLAPSSQVAVKGTPLGQLYDAAYQTPIDYSSKAGRNLEGLLSRVPKRYIDAANELIAADINSSGVKQILADVADDGRVTFREMPTVEQIDKITRGINAVVRREEGAGALGGQTDLGRTFGNLSREIRKNLKEAVPAYGKALDSAATEIGARQAQEFGQTAFRASVTRAEIAEEMASMGAAERAHLKIGVRQGIEEAMDNVKRTVTDPNVDAREATKAIKDFSSKAARDKLALIFGDKEAAAFTKQLEEAASALDLRAGVARNSQTFARQETDRIVRDRLGSGPIETLARGEPVGATKRIVQALTGRTPANTATREQQVYAEIARLLTGPRGDEAIRAMQMLEGIGASRPISQAAANRVGQATAGAVALPGYLLGTRSSQGR